MINLFRSRVLAKSHVLRSFWVEKLGFNDPEECTHSIPFLVIGMAALVLAAEQGLGIRIPNILCSIQ